MGEQRRTVFASTEDLRTLLVLIHSTIAYGGSAVALTLLGAWGFIGLKDELDVPVMLPVLAIAATLFAVVAWTSEEEIRKVGKPYRTTVGSPRPPER